ncbi:MAG TPA: hypothetical protein VJV79_28295 [Polyangiaceae bacterium]|nr:hypothetical protein [Polyangiaceae bacterium]
MTFLFVWACSSGDHEEASVTTSGGAGSAVTAGGVAPAEADAGSEGGIGGATTIDRMPINQGGAVHDWLPPDLEPSAGGVPEPSTAGADNAAPPLSMGGTSGTNHSAGASSAGAATAGTSGAGFPAAAGAPAVIEVACDPADDPSTLDMVLPCDVSTALYVCRNCHTNPPVKGVFSSYVTFADIKPNARQIYAVIKGGTMPRPPYTMSAWQKATALKWLGQNGSCAIGAAKSCQ